MKIKNVSIEKVIPYARNPRRNQGAIAKVAASIKEFGWQQPIVVDTEMVVIAGHTRLAAAQSLGMSEVPIVVADNLTSAQVKAYRLADNRVSQEAEWDDDLLRLELSDLKELDFDLVLTGFSLAEISPETLEKEVGANDAYEEWKEMPEFDQQDKTAYRSFPVHFKNQEAVDEFAALINQKITDRTRYIWFPYIEIERMVDKEYVPES